MSRTSSWVAATVFGVVLGVTAQAHSQPCPVDRGSTNPLGIPAGSHVSLVRPINSRAVGSSAATGLSVTQTLQEYGMLRRRSRRLQPGRF